MAKARARPKVARTLARPLARVGDPLVLADGRIIEPTPAGGIKIERQPDVKAHKYKPTVKRNMADLPAAPGVLNGVACVLMFSLLGVADREIADTLRLSSNQVKEVRKHPAYTECFELVRDEFINVNSELIHARIAAYGGDAVTTMAHLAFNGKHESTKFKASQDLLDRGGFTKKEHSKHNGMGDALRIVMIKGDDRTEVSIGGDAFKEG